MPFSARIFRNLETELNRQLAFTFCLVRGNEPIEPGERFRVAVSIRNNSSVALKNVRGVLRPGTQVIFRNTSFNLASLGAHEQCEVAQMDVRRHEQPGERRFSLEEFATINVTGQADLSDFWFRDSGRPLTYARPTISAGVPLSGAPERLASRLDDSMNRRRFEGRSIPLSCGPKDA